LLHLQYTTKRSKQQAQQGKILRLLQEQQSKNTKKISFYLLFCFFESCVFGIFASKALVLRRVEMLFGAF